MKCLILVCGCGWLEIIDGIANCLYIDGPAAKVYKQSLVLHLCR